MLHLWRSEHLAAGSIAIRATLFSAVAFGAILASRTFNDIPVGILVALACSTLLLVKNILADCIIMPIIALENELEAIHLFWKRDFTLWQLLKDKCVLFTTVSLYTAPIDFVLLWLVCADTWLALLLTIVVTTSNLLLQLAELSVSAIFFQKDHERVSEMGNSQKAETVGIMCSAPILAGFGGALWSLISWNGFPLTQLAVVAAATISSTLVALLTIRYLSVKRLSEVYAG